MLDGLYGQSLSKDSSNKSNPHENSKSLKQLVTRLSNYKKLTDHEVFRFSSHLDNESIDFQQRLKALKLYVKTKIGGLPDLDEKLRSKEIEDLLMFVRDRKNSIQNKSKASEVLSGLNKQIYFALKKYMVQSVEIRSKKFAHNLEYQGLTSNYMVEKFPLMNFHQAGYDKVNSREVLSELIINSYAENSTGLIFKSENMANNLKLRDEMYQIYPKFFTYRVASKAFHLSNYSFSRILKLYILEPKKNHFFIFEQNYKSSFLEVDRYLEWLKNQLLKRDSYRKEVETKIERSRLETEERFRKKRDEAKPKKKNGLPSGKNEYLPVGHDESHWWSGE